jgi:hypothetical protein
MTDYEWAAAHEERGEVALKMFDYFLVAEIRDEGVVGSNPITPTNSHPLKCAKIRMARKEAAPGRGL